jgi:hypothetical protein
MEFENLNFMLYFCCDLDFFATTINTKKWLKKSSPKTNSTKLSRVARLHAILQPHGVAHAK